MAKKLNRKEKLIVLLGAVVLSVQIGLAFWNWHAAVILLLMQIAINTGGTKANTTGLRWPVRL